jgi:nitroreductase
MLDLLKKRRSIRAFQNKEIEKEKIQQIMEAALLSPSSKNNNPWKFIIVKESKLLLKLSKAKAQGSQFIAKAPVGIIVLADPLQSDVWVEDCSIVSTVILLTAQNEGLGSCWIQIRKREGSDGINSEKYIKELLNIPDNLRVLSMVAIGYPAENKLDKKIPKEKIKDIYLNKYGDLWDNNI